MTAAEGNRTKAGSIPALERATGRSWSEWLEHFARHGAASRDHAEIARIARAGMPDGVQNPDWWAQGAAIAFEQHAGLRVPGQSSDGTFRVSASCTVGMDRDSAIEAWAAGPGGAAEQRRLAVSEPRRSRTEKRSFWRAEIEGCGRIEVAASAKDGDRSLVALQHTGISEPEVIEAWRAHWKALLAEL